MKILIITDPNQPALTPADRATIEAARQLGVPITLLSRHPPPDDTPIDVYIKITPQSVEQLADQLVNFANAFSHCMAPSSSFFKGFMPRLAAKLGVPMLSDVVAILAPDRFVRPIHAGNILTTCNIRQSPVVLTIRPTAFTPQEQQAATKPAERQPHTWPDIPLLSHFVRHTSAPTDLPDLSSAKVVVVGGRGADRADDFTQLTKLARLLGGAVGATRAAVDAGLAPNAWQVGQTGKIIAPELYIGIGVSGALQHLAGIKDARYIVAINNDPQAPIFSVADWGLVADLHQAIPELIDQLSDESA